MSIEKVMEDTKLFLDSLSDLIVVLDNQYNIVFANKVMSSKLGIQQKELIGLKCYECIHGTDQPLVLCPHSMLLRDGKKHEIEMQENKLGGYCHVTCSPIHDKNGEVIGSTHLVRNVDDPKVVGEKFRGKYQNGIESTLKTNEEHFRNLVEKSWDAILLINAQTEIIYTSPSTDRITGYSSDEISNLDILTFIHPDDHNKAYSLFNSLLQKKDETVTIELRAKHKNGSWIWIEGTARNLLDDPNINAIIINYRDITELKKSELLLRIQHDLSAKLAGISDMDEACNEILQACTQIEGIDCGGVYLVDQDRSTVDLIAHIGLTEDYVKNVSQYDADSRKTQVVMNNEPVYYSYEDINNGFPSYNIIRQENLHAIAVIPFTFNNQVIGCMNLGSHHIDNISANTRLVIESIASRLGAAIVRIQTRDKLKESEERYRQLFAQMLSGGTLNEIICDSNGQAIDYITLDINSSFEFLLNVKSESIVGKKASEILPSEELSHWLEIFGTVALTGNPRKYEMYSTLNKKYFEGNVFSPEIGKFAVVFSDVTEKKQSEIKLKERENRYRNVIKQAEGVVYQRDDERENYTFIDEGIINLTGYSSSEITSGLFMSLIEEELFRNDQPIAYEMTSQSIGEKAFSHRAEYRIKTKDGQIKFLSDSELEIQDINGQVIHRLGMLQDIAERKEAEEQIRWNARVNESLAELYKPLISASSMKEIADTILNQAQKLTGSKHGYVSSINPVTGDNVGHTLTNMMGDACHVTDENKRIAFSKGSDGCYHGLFGHSLNIGESFFTNSPAIHSSSSGVPDGHIPLERFLSVPVMLGEELVGQIALANPDQDYTNDDLDAIKRLAEYYALAIQRMRMEDKLVTNENRYRNVIAQAGGVAYQRDWQNGTYTFMDEGIKQLTGYSSDEMTPKLFERLVDEENPDGVNKKFIRSEISQQIGGDAATSYQGEYRIKTKEGQIKYVSDSSIELHNTNDEAVQTLGMLQDITQRKLSEEQLRSSEIKYRTLFNSLSDALFIHDLEGHFLEVNDVTVERLGYNREELSNMTLVDIILPKYAELIPERMEKLINKGCAFFETEHITKDGIRIPIEVSGKIIDYNGMPAVLSINRDITERKQTEDKLHESEEIFRYFMEYSPIYVFFKDENIRSLQLSNNYETMLGKPIMELLGKNMYELFPSELAKNMVADDMRTMEEGKATTVEEELNGRFYTTIKFPIHVDGKPRYLAGYTIDITERKQAEEKLRESEERYRSLFEGVPIGLYRTSPSGQILDVNKADIDLLGYPDKNTFLAINAKDTYVDPDIRDKKLSEVNRKGSLYTEIQLRRYDGTHIWVHNIIKAVKDEQGSVLYYDGIMEDITDRKQAEELKIKLQQASKMESIGRLAGGVAHDFNNLLTVIQGSASLGLRNLSKHDPLYNRLNMILEASERAAELTRQLLAFSRKQIIEMKVINLNHVITNLSKMLGRLVGEDIEIKTIPSKDIGNVNADVGQIEQIIVNLSVNARDAMPEGGKLTIETSNIELDEPYCQTHLNTKPGKHVMLMVCDDGSGMDNATKEHIFEPFFTTKGVGEGTGLGLATVYGIVRQHDGSIEFYSELGHGTTFKIYLPTVEDELSIELKESKKEEILTGNETILVVEDEDIVREMAVEFLEHLGYNVISAENGGMALMIAEQHKGKIHLMLTDVVMPNINGRQLAERLQREHPGMKVLYTSGYTENVIVHHGILDSGLNFIGKPYRLPTLAKKLRDLLNATL